MRWLLLAMPALLAAAPAGATSRLHLLDRFELRLGEQGAWQSVSLDAIPRAPQQVVWLRSTVELPPDLRREGHPLGIYVGALASHELWWDGVLLGRGGVVGPSAAEERPGPIEAHYQVPDRLAVPGPHTLVLRTSAFHRHFRPRNGYWAVVVGDYESIVALRQGSAWLALVALSGLLLTAAFAFALYTRARERSSLLLALLALSAACMLVTEAWRPLVGYSYDRHVVRLGLLLALSWLTGLQLVAFVVARFPRRGGRALLVAAALAATASPLLAEGWDNKSLLVHLVCLTSALGWTAGAATRRAPGSRLALAGLIVVLTALLTQPLGFLDYALYLSLDLLFLLLLWAHAGEVQRDREQRQAAVVKSSRLELEILRRHLQPHFLMNSLTALAEWVEEDPPTAVRMIDALAGELRLLGDLAGRKLIRAEEELSLCHHHLATMSLRKDVRYELTVEGLAGDEALPPGVLHTLVENAVTHGPCAPQVTLRLSAAVAGGRRHLLLVSPTEVDGAVNGAGTGTRYVEARLREAWGDEWSFRQRREGASWRAELEVPAASAP
jgi:hypothetical protein